MANTTQPQFTHDCESCTFLGRYDSDRPADLYVCLTSMGGPSLIARYGSEGPDYGSVPASMLYTASLRPVYLEIGRRCRKAKIKLRRQS